MATLKLQEFPKTVQLVAAILIAKPVLDIIMMELTDAHNFNWISWILLSAAGMSLLVRHKTAWIFSNILCFLFMIATGVSISQDFDSTEQVLNIAKVVDCFLVIVIVGVVAYYFRFPYLDRRQGWLAPTADRTEATMPLVLGPVEVTTVDLSYTGAQVLNTSSHVFTVGEKVPFQIEEIGDIRGTAKIIAIHEQSVRIQFEGLTSTQSSLLQQWLNLRKKDKT